MTTDQHLSTGAMALGSLPEDEAAAFVEHLEVCPTCSAELASFLETAAMLGGSVAQTPPASLRRSVMEAVSRTPQLPPLTDPAAELGRHRSSEAPPDPSAAAAPAADSEPQLATVVRLTRPWYRRPQALIAAAVAVLVIGGGTGVVLAERSPAPVSADACLAATSNKSVLSPTVGTGGTVTLAPTCDLAVVNVPTLPPAPTGKVYQLWVIAGSNATSVGVLKPNTDGSFSSIDATVHAGDKAVGVSVEPSPGSAKPTTTPLWVVPLAT